jgi:hypothetical protein
MASHLGRVDARNLESWMSEAMGELAVIGKKDEAQGLGIQTADGIEALVATHEVSYSRPPLWISNGRNYSTRFVQEDVFVSPADIDAFSVYLDACMCRINPHALHAYDLSVDRDSACFDQLFGSATGCDPRGGDDLLKTLPVRCGL